MRILQQGLDDTTVGFLQGAGIVANKSDEPLTAEDLPAWLSGNQYDAFVFAFEGDLGLYTPRPLRTKHGLSVPIIGICELGDDPWPVRRATFLEQGGDDLFKSPPNPRELAASLRAAARRFKGGLLDILVFQVGKATVKMNQAAFTIQVNGERVAMGPTELNLALFFARSPGRVRTRQEILDGVWGDIEVDERTIDVHIGRLRKALVAKHPDAGNLVETVRAGGYILNLRPTIEKVSG